MPIKNFALEGLYSMTLENNSEGVCLIACLSPVRKVSRGHEQQMAQASLSDTRKRSTPFPQEIAQ